MRQSAWLALLGILDLEDARHTIRLNLRQETNQESELIRQDVGRSALFRYQAVTGSLVKGEQQSEGLKEKLASVLNAAVSMPFSESDNKPSYYQGLHDIASILLFNLNFDEVKTAAVLRKLVETKLQDAVQSDFTNVTALLDIVLMPYLYSLDPEVYQAIVESEVPVASAIMPWLITLFAHDVHDTAVASRLMDAFIASHSALPFYMAVALLVHSSLRHQLLEAVFDPGMMHIALQRLPGELQNDFTTRVQDEVVVTAQDIIDLAQKLMRETPPEALLKFVGVGRKPRTQRRLVNKVRGVAILNMPPLEPSSIRVRAEAVLANCNISWAQVQQYIQPLWNNVGQLCSSMAEQGNKMLVYSRGSLNIVQILVLFLFMPQQYVRDFMYLMQAVSRFCAKDVP
jgi:hypothetical protein